jgi:hypothetical protein
VDASSISHYFPLSGKDTVLMSKDDYLDIRVYQGSGSAKNILGSPVDYSYACFTRLDDPPITFNPDLHDEDYLDINVHHACTARLFVGSYLGGDE